MFLSLPLFLSLALSDSRSLSIVGLANFLVCFASSLYRRRLGLWPFSLYTHVDTHTHECVHTYTLVILLLPAAFGLPDRSGAILRLAFASSSLPSHNPCPSTHLKSGGVPATAPLWTLHVDTRQLSSFSLSPTLLITLSLRSSLSLVVSFYSSVRLNKIPQLLRLKFLTLVWTTYDVVFFGHSWILRTFYVRKRRHYNLQKQLERGEKVSFQVSQSVSSTFSAFRPLNVDRNIFAFERNSFN